MEENSSTYFFINLYGNPEIEIVKTAYSLISDEEICEQIMHLSDGHINDEPVPNGINKDYFNGRKLEYDLLNSEDFQILLNEEKRRGLLLGSFQSFTSTIA